MTYIGKSIKDKQVSKIEAGLSSILAENEKLVAVFFAHSFNPMTDAIVLTNQRLMCVCISKIEYGKGFFNETAGDDIDRLELEKKFSFSKLYVIRKDQTKDFLASIYATDYEDMCKVVERMSGSPTPLGNSSNDSTASNSNIVAELKSIAIGKVNNASLQEIQKSCRSGEKPEFILGDGINGVLAAFDDRCMVIKKGLGTSFMSSSLGGGRVSTFYYRDITGIEYNSGLMTGVLEILTASYTGKTTNSPWSFGSEKSAHESSNTLPWGKIFYNQVRPQIEWMQEKIHQVKSGGGQTLVQTSSSDELTKLAGLHEKGILTDKEFAEAKQKILNKM